MTDRDGYGSTSVVDVAALFGAHGAPAATTDRAIVKALKQHGSFVAAGAWPGIDRQAAELFAFFSMKTWAKESCATCQSRPMNPNIYRGFYPVEEGDAWSRKAIFDIGPEPPMTAPDLPGAEAFREPNAWPDIEPWEGWRDAMMAMMTHMRTIAVTILGAVSRGLLLRDDALVVPARGRNATLRLLHCTFGEDGFGDEVITGCHVDTGLLSIIWQDHIGELQMQGPDGTWRTTPIVTDGLSVHCGDLVKVASGGRIKGTPHRVLKTDGSRRCSMGFFLEPCFEACVLPPSGEPVSYARHLITEFPERFRRT